MKFTKYFFLAAGLILFIGTFSQVESSNSEIFDECTVYVENEIIFLSGSSCESGESTCNCAEGQCCEAGGGTCACTSCDSNDDDDDGFDWTELLKLIPYLLT